MRVPIVDSLLPDYGAIHFPSVQQKLSLAFHAFKDVDVKDRAAALQNFIATQINSFEREKWANRAGFVREWYIVIGVVIGWLGWSTPGGLNNSQGFFENTLGTIGWNITDGIHEALLFPDKFRKATNKNEKIVVCLNAFYSICVEQVCTLLPYLTVVSAAKNAGIGKVFFKCDFDLGHDKLEALSNFSFGAGSFFSALSSANRLYRLSHQSSDIEPYSLNEEVVHNPSSLFVQKEKIKTCAIDMVRYFFVTLGGSAGGISMLIYPELFALLSAIFYSAAMLLKLQQFVASKYFNKAEEIVDALATPII